MGLYWVRPYAFVSLDSRNRWYLGDMKTAGPVVASAFPKEKGSPLPSGAEYLAICDIVRSQLGSKDCPYQDFPALSNAAFIESERVNEERKAAAKASRNTSFPQIAPASQSHRPARPLYTWQRRCKENSRRMDMDVPWFRTCRRPISMGQHICTGTRVAHPEFLPGPGIPKQTYGFSVPRENQTVIRAFRSKHPAC